jgi:hypothetical protein
MLNCQKPIPACDDPLLTIGEIARRSNDFRDRIDRAMCRGRLPFVVEDGRRKSRTSWVDAWNERRRVGAIRRAARAEACQ